MSRVTKFNEEFSISYGRDHFFGNFIQVYKRDSKVFQVDTGGTLTTSLMAKDEDPILNKDGLTVGEVVEIASDYGFDLLDELNPF